MQSFQIKLGYLFISFIFLQINLHEKEYYTIFNLEKEPMTSVKI